MLHFSPTEYIILLTTLKRSNLLLGSLDFSGSASYSPAVTLTRTTRWYFVNWPVYIHEHWVKRSAAKLGNRFIIKPLIILLTMAYMHRMIYEE